MQAKRRTGRPKLPKDAVRRFVIGMTVTGEERKRIKAAAEADRIIVFGSFLTVAAAMPAPAGRSGRRGPPP